MSLYFSKYLIWFVAYFFCSGVEKCFFFATILTFRFHCNLIDSIFKQVLEQTMCLKVSQRNITIFIRNYNIFRFIRNFNSTGIVNIPWLLRHDERMLQHTFSVDFCPYFPFFPNSFEESCNRFVTLLVYGYSCICICYPFFFHLLIIWNLQSLLRHFRFEFSKSRLFSLFRVKMG